ncbi:MAG: hypothetical protein DYH06_17735, partial [Acidobacteria bacterium ACB2]|nr:hypothetical protein [Acidobacteria bacterium ACB2]
MKSTPRLLAALLLALAVAGVAAAQETTPPPTTTAPAAPVALKPHQEVIKLFQAGLSEEFIKRKIKAEGTGYDLSVDDIVACKNARLPGGLIEAMMATRKRAEAPAAPAKAAP